MYTVRSDGDGHFLLKDVPAGRYKFFALHAGYVKLNYRSRGGAEDGAVLSLRAGQKVDDILFRLTRAAVITGILTSESGEPLTGAMVAALRKPTEDEIEDQNRGARQRQFVTVGASRTDDRGQYRIFGLNPGEYYLRATDLTYPDAAFGLEQDYWVQQNMGSEYAPAYYPGTAQLGQAETISVRAGEETQADLSLQRIKYVEISGEVIGLKGPEKGAWVSLTSTGTESSEIDEGHNNTTDEKGHFTLKGVPPGSYILAAYQRSEDGDSYNVSGRQKIEVTEESKQSVTLYVGLGANFDGRVIVAGSGERPRELGLVLSSPDGDHEAWTRPKKDGTFDMRSVPDGTFALQVYGLESGWFIKSAKIGAHDILEEGLEVEKGATGGRLEVVLSSACPQLEGAVIENDQPLTGARVRITPEPENFYNKFRASSTKTDQMGHFSFNCVPPGKYRVVAKSPPSEGIDPIKSEPQSVTLAEGDHKSIDAKIVKPESEQTAAPSSDPTAH
jgi:protocatechuate 3,4-dioxygenase beta subunit